MSYKNDHLLTISNKYGKASSDAKALVFETYDRLRDLTVSGPGLGGATAYGTIGNFLINLTKLVGPSNYMPVLGSSAINIPGTSYSYPVSGGYSTTPGVQSSFGMRNLAKYPGFPTGSAAPLYNSIMSLGSSLVPLASTFSIGGMPTGGAAPVTTSIPGGNSYIPAAGVFTGMSAASGGFSDITLPVAGVVGGVGGLITHLAPYFGPSGLVAALAGNLMSGYSGAAISAYQYVTGRIITNADTILTMKIKNLETTVKQLDVQGDIIKKMLKSSIEGDSKAVNEL